MHVAVCWTYGPAAVILCASAVYSGAGAETRCGIGVLLSWSEAAVIRALTICVAFAVTCLGQPVKADRERTTVPSINVTRCDPLLRLFPDLPSPPVYTGAAHVPRGGPAPMLFAVSSSHDRTCRVTVTDAQRADGTPLRGQALVYGLLPVHVEGNTQGSMCSKPGGAVPEGWLAHLVRAAPFDTAEVLVRGDTIALSAGLTHGLLLDIQVGRDALPGRYQGRVELTDGGASASAPFDVHVHSTVLPKQLALHSVHWLSPDPVNLTNATAPDWWSAAHWELLAQAGTQLRAFGDDTMFTPLVEGEHPLIAVTQRGDGAYAFDYSRFDRWVALFRGQGFRLFAGRHLTHMGHTVFVRNERAGRTARPFHQDPGQTAWLAFLPVFLRDYRKHLEERHWVDSFLQHQYDEPKDEALYATISAAVRENLPGVGAIDAINSRAKTFSPLVDHLVFNLGGLMGNRALAAARVTEGRCNWLYHCTSPYPPYPNRHIDCALSACRLWPWLCAVYKAHGFLFWAANLYRGTVDEYASSLGPMRPLKPGEKLEVGHPPGDDWFYYRGPEGLRPSVRSLAFREGLIDHTLLTMLGERDPARARAIQERIVAGVVRRVKPRPADWSWSRYREEVNYLDATYSRTPADYHAARAEILDALGQADKGVDQP